MVLKYIEKKTQNRNSGSSNWILKVVKTTEHFIIVAQQHQTQSSILRLLKFVYRVGKATLKVKRKIDRIFMFYSRFCLINLAHSCSW